MNILKSLNQNIKNIFVGSHKGEDINLEVFKDKPLSPNNKVLSTPQPPPGFVASEKVNEPGSNDLGFNPNKWFDNKYAEPERRVELEEELDLAPSEYEPPYDEDWFSTPKNEKEEEITMHEKMYRMATDRYNPFSLGGSENCDSDISHNAGGSENVQKL